MTKRLILFILTSCFMLTGCQPLRVQQLAADGVEAAVQGNNGGVAKLTAIQETAKLRRKAAMVEAARQADSYDGGKKELDAIDARYRTVFDLFRDAERVQGALADALELARASIAADDQPEMATLIALFVQLQQVYAALLSARP